MDLRKDTLFFDALVDFPTYGQEDKLYLDKANGALYYWDGSAYALAGDGTGGVTAVTATAPIASSGGATPDISITQASGSVNGYLSSADWTTFNGKQNAITLTTTGTSGAATLVGSTLNIPQYAGGLTYFTEAQATAAPNATVNVDSLTAAGSTTNVDVAIVPKGTGAFMLDIPDNTATGGNKRGANAVDLQTTRTNANQVASGDYSFVAGTENKATSNYAVALGGGNTSGYGSMTAGVGNSATALFSTAFGYNTQATGNGSFAAGWLATASNTYAISLGYSTQASGYGSVALNHSTTASGDYSISSGNGSSTLGITSRRSHGYFNSVTADCQKSEFPLSKRTTDATATTLTVGGGGASTVNQVILSNNSAYRFKGTIIGKQSGSTNAAAWDIDGLIVRGANAAATTLTLGNVNLVSNTPAWGTPTLAADTTNGGLRVQVTGAAATNIQWTAVIETTEVIYA